MGWGNRVNFEELLGKTFTEVVQRGDDEIIFTMENGDWYKLYHSQDCCESVYIESIVGDLADLVGEPIVRAEEATSGENPHGVQMGYQDSFTWTFYKLATRKGYVDMRWYGSSNGYYSESVRLEFHEKDSKKNQWDD